MSESPMLGYEWHADLGERPSEHDRRKGDERRGTRPGGYLKAGDSWHRAEGFSRDTRSGTDRREGGERRQGESVVDTVGILRCPDCKGQGGFTVTHYVTRDMAIDAGEPLSGGGANVQTCPTCGHPREVYTSDEGTSGFVPPRGDARYEDELPEWLESFIETIWDAACAWEGDDADAFVAHWKQYVQARAALRARLTQQPERGDREFAFVGVRGNLDGIAWHLKRALAILDGEKVEPGNKDLRHYVEWAACAAASTLEILPDAIGASTPLPPANEPDGAQQQPEGEREAVACARFTDHVRDKWWGDVPESVRESWRQSEGTQRALDALKASRAPFVLAPDPREGETTT